MCELLSEGGRCRGCSRRAAAARIASSEARSARALEDVRTVAANGAPTGIAPEAHDDNGGSGLYLAPTGKPGIAQVRQPGAKRKKLREILNALRNAAAKRSAARRALATEAAEAKYLAELDEACDLVDRREAELELELIAAATDDHSIGGEKHLLDLEAEACERERQAAAAELAAIRAAWRESDNRLVNGRHTKAFERRAYLEGRPVMVEGEPMPAELFGQARASRADAARRRLKKLEGSWTPAAEKRHQKALAEAETAALKKRQAWVDAHPAHYQWPDPSAPVTSRGHLGMLEARAATARRIAEARPSAADRASRISEARFEVTMAKRNLAALQDRHAKTA